MHERHDKTTQAMRARQRLWARGVLRGVALLAGLGGWLVATAAGAVTMDWVTVGSPGNACDPQSQGCFGSVAETFRISKFEVTNAQYAEFLNQKAATSDPLGLFSPSMASSSHGGIVRSGSAGSFTFSAKPGFESKPVNFVSFFDSLRFTNWLNNGQGSADTETGAYTLLGGTATPSNGSTVTRNADARIFLPSENEWFKAAFFDPGTQSFLDFPAGFDAQIGCAAPGPSPNTANCGNVNGGPTEVGAFTGSASPNGTFDQGGNVREWNEQIVFGSGSGRGLRGGTFGNDPDRLAASIRNHFGPILESKDLGFRVASLSVPEPGTALLVMAGMLGLAGWRRRNA